MRLLAKVFLPLIVSIPLCGYLVFDDTPNFYLTSDTIGPLTAYQEDIKLNVTLRCKTKALTFIDRFRCGPSEDDFRYSKSGTYRHVINYTYNLTFNIPTSSYLSKQGMFCQILIENNYNNPLATFSFTLTPIKTKQSIKAEDYSNSPFSVDNVYYHFEKAGLIIEKETISFPNYLSYLNIDTYHKLALDSVLISSNNENPSYGLASLTIPDYENIFPYFIHSINNTISVPLKLIKTGECWTFAFKNTMYVNPNNLIMSHLPRNGFVATNNFYLPVNEKNKLLDEKIKIELNGFGIGKTNITWSLEYLANQNLVGKCENSQYCIVGEEI